MKILIVTENEKFAKALRMYLEKKERYSIHHISNPDEAFTVLLPQNPEHKEYVGVFIDLALSNRAGIELSARIRKEGISIPIIVFGEKNNESERVEALKSGANDYLIKPVPFRSVISAIKSYIEPFTQNASAGTPSMLTAGNIVIHATSERAFMDNMEIKLTAKEFDLLHYLAKNPDRIVDRDELYREIWKNPGKRNSNIVDVHIKNLRKKLQRGEEESDHIKTFRGKGYRLHK